LCVVASAIGHCCINEEGVVVFKQGYYHVSCALKFSHQHIV